MPVPAVRALAVVVALIVPLAAQRALQEHAGRTMGSTFAVRWHGGGDADAVRAVVDDELAQTEATFSQWRQDSELLRFNAHRATSPFAASERLRAAAALALRVAVATDGAFDPTVKPWSDLYRRMKREPDFTPSDAQLAAARERMDWRRLHVTDAALVKDRDDVEIDLDGLVAGFAADRIAARFEALGVRDFVLEITGEVLARGARPDGTPWRGGIVDPARSEFGHERALVQVPLRDRALCTSGDYRNLVVRDGVATSHIVDPRTGRSADHGVVSVSVLARSCALADALGTALLVLGPEAAASALQRCAEPDAGAWFVLAADTEQLPVVKVGWPELFALDGRPLSLPPLAADVRAARERDLAAAVAAVQRAPTDVDAIVWHARRLGYLGRIDDAIAELTRGLALHPDEPHLLRHRGHRWLTLRDFAAAEQDLAAAAVAVRGKPDEVEPDGQPTAGRPPHSTLHYNIHYHLGLARFLRGDWAAAEAASRDCLAAARNDECRVAVAHWLWCACMRQGHVEAARAAVADIAAVMDVVDNRGYQQLDLLYRGDRKVDELTAGAGSKGASIAFGVAHWRLCTGDAAGARAGFAALAASGEATAFGVIAAEAELQRTDRNAAGR